MSDQEEHDPIRSRLVASIQRVQAKVNRGEPLSDEDFQDHQSDVLLAYDSQTARINGKLNRNPWAIKALWLLATAVPSTIAGLAIWLVTRGFQ
jgi:hypothetical protein